MPFSLQKEKKWNFLFLKCIYVQRTNTHRICLKKDQVIIFQGCSNFEPMRAEFRIDEAQRYTHTHTEATGMWERNTLLLVRACWKLKFIDRSTGTRQFSNTLREENVRRVFANNSFQNKLTFEQSQIRFILESEFPYFPNRHQHGFHRDEIAQTFCLLMCARQFIYFFGLLLHIHFHRGNNKSIILGGGL